VLDPTVDHPSVSITVPEAGVGARRLTPLAVRVARARPNVRVSVDVRRPRLETGVRGIPGVLAEEEGVALRRMA
jgi:hypothetical protein